MPERAQAMIFATANLRLDTLVGLRWLAVAGQVVAIVVVEFLLRFPLPFVECMALIGLSALVNLGLRARYPATTRLEPWPAFLLLAYDVLQLAALLFLTGGLENPFSVLLLVPLIVSATTLGPRQTMLLGAVIVLAASGLAMAHLPLPWRPGEVFQLPLVYAAGVWVALVSTSIFTGIYAFRVADEARQLARALNEAERVLEREQALHALDGLAAAAAHELGTPLATIALVARELEHALAESRHAEDIALLKSQSQRCRDILARLTSLSEADDGHLARMPLSHLVEEIAEPYRGFAAEIVIERPQGAGPEPVGNRNPAIVQGLSNIVENAVDFARTRVTIAAAWTDDTVSITVSDDGPGFAAGILERIGEPYLTTRPSEHGDDAQSGGMGLGFFIAKTLLERSGARLDLGNREPPYRGARVAVTWPRRLMDRAAAGGDSATPPLARAAEND